MNRERLHIACRIKTSRVLNLIIFLFRKNYETYRIILNKKNVGFNYTGYNTVIMQPSPGILGGWGCVDILRLGPP